MAFFFFLVALEIKRELVSGELRDPRAAALPMIAAVGGMVVPALVYTTLNGGGPGSHGWGIPMATDIAFAVAVVTAAGPRVPAGARLFLLTLAIVDDLGAILVIAVFYTAGLALAWLILAAAAVVAAAVLTGIHVRWQVPYVVLALVCWFALHESGVHATIAGVVFGFVTPTWSFYDPYHFAKRARPLVDSVEACFTDRRVTDTEYAVIQTSLRDLGRLAHETDPPLERMEHLLTPWVSLLVIPLFALANSGLTVSADAFTNLAQDDVALGVVLGLVVGKTVGVFGATWLATRMGIAPLPKGTTWQHLLGIAVTAGVGFTVALFVSDLAFTEPELGNSAKLGILIGSALAGVLGFLILRRSPEEADR
jgi:NhaA family Na+:H+ antiporter